MIDSLKMKDETATAIVALAIEFETFTDDMPESEKDRLEAAHEAVTFAIDAYKDDGIRADSDDPDTAEAGEQVEALLKVAGIKIDDDGDIEYGKALTGAKLAKVLSQHDLELTDEEEAEGEEEESGSDDEAAFEIDDIIEGYDELTPASKIKEIKKLKLDAEDDDDLATLNSIADFEEAQDKPSSRVLNYLEELIGEEEEAEASADDEGEEEEPEAEADGDEDEEPWDEDALAELDKEQLKEVAEEFGVDFPKRLTDTGRKRTIDAILEAQGGEEEEGEEEESEAEGEEPFEGYDDSTISKIKKLLTEAANDEDEPLEVEQVEAVIEYEEANQERSSLVKWLGELKDAIAEAEGEEEEAEEEEDEKPTKAKAKRGKKATADSDFDPDDDDIESMLPKGLARTFVQSQLKSAETQLEEHGLVAPVDYDGEFPELPDDIDATDYSELSNTLMAFQNAHATATWQKSFHYIWSGTFDEIAEYMEAVALIDAEGPNEPARKAAARIDDRVVFFRARHKEHYNSYVRFRDFSSMLEGKIKTTSRVLGFKDDEEEAGNLTGKVKANGSSKRTPAGMKKSSSRRSRVK